MDLVRYIRDIPDFPKPGILFYDITTMLKNARGMRLVTDRMAEHFRGQQIDQVIASNGVTHV